MNAACRKSFSCRFGGSFDDRFVQEHVEHLSKCRGWEYFTFGHHRSRLSAAAIERSHHGAPRHIRRRNLPDHSRSENSSWNQLEIYGRGLRCHSPRYMPRTFCPTVTSKIFRAKRALVVFHKSTKDLDEIQRIITVLSLSAPVHSLDPGSVSVYKLDKLRTEWSRWDTSNFHRKQFVS